jgi:hypothetical protein
MATGRVILGVLTAQPTNETWMHFFFVLLPRRSLPAGYVVRALCRALSIGKAAQVTCQGRDERPESNHFAPSSHQKGEPAAHRATRRTTFNRPAEHAAAVDREARPMFRRH